MRPTRDYRGLESRSREQERRRKAFWLATASLWTLSFRQQLVDPKDILFEQLMKITIYFLFVSSWLIQMKFFEQLMKITILLVEADKEKYDLARISKKREKYNIARSSG